MKKFLGKFLVITLTLLFLGSIFSFAIPRVFAQEKEIDFNCVREKLLAGEDPGVCKGGTSGNGTGSGIDTNFLGVEFSPDQEGVARVVRSAITVAFGLLVVLAVFYGIWGIYVRSTASDNEDKMKQSVSIFKNAVLGIVITIIGFVVVEVLSILLGLGNIWEITFQGRMVGALSDCGANNEMGDVCIVRTQTSGVKEYCTYEWNGNTWISKGCKK